MNEQEHQSRLEALGHAARHKAREETSDDVVESAEKYFEFLRGDEDPE